MDREGWEVFSASDGSRRREHVRPTAASVSVRTAGTDGFSFVTPTRRLIWIDDAAFANAGYNGGAR